MPLLDDMQPKISRRLRMLAAVFLMHYRLMY